MATYKVWSLDVWGHSHKDCGSCDSGCECVKLNEETGEYEDTDHECQCGYDVNDRFPVGSVDIPSDATDSEVLRIFDANGFIHAPLCVVDDYSDECCFGIASKDNDRPLFQLECQED